MSRFRCRHFTQELRCINLQERNTVSGARCGHITDSRSRSRCVTQLHAIMSDCAGRSKTYAAVTFSIISVTAVTFLLSYHCPGVRYVGFRQLSITSHETNSSQKPASTIHQFSVHVRTDLLCQHLHCTLLFVPPPCLLPLPICIDIFVSFCLFKRPVK